MIKALAEKYGKTPAQIILNWHLHRGHLIIPKTVNASRLVENLNSYDFTLSEADYLSISMLDKHARFFNPKLIGALGFNNLPYFD